MLRVDAYRWRSAPEGRTAPPSGDRISGVARGTIATSEIKEPGKNLTSLPLKHTSPRLPPGGADVISLQMLEIWLLELEACSYGFLTIGKFNIEHSASFSITLQGLPIILPDIVFFEVL